MARHLELLSSWPGRLSHGAIVKEIQFLENGRLHYEIVKGSLGEVSLETFFFLSKPSQLFLGVNHQNPWGKKVYFEVFSITFHDS